MIADQFSLDVTALRTLAGTEPLPALLRQLIGVQNQQRAGAGAAAALTARLTGLSEPERERLLELYRDLVGPAR